MFKMYFRISLLVVLLLTGCKKNDPDEPNWSNSMLLEIPSKIRFQQYNRGNLIPNASFEENKLIKLDSTHFTYNITAWRKDVNNVKYIDYKTDSLSPRIHVSHGRCAVKISRATSNEYDEKGNAIVSDFIKVIPGMYDLYADIKCEGIEPYEKRFNKYLNDAIDIRLLYFDKAKQPINPSAYEPLIKQFIDNSFKGFSFSRFESVDSLKWSTLKCVSGSYPFNESVIPDDARFVKVYIGLKGTGTIYVDNIRFFYSKENLTPKERSSFYFDSLRSPLDWLVPTPQYKKFIDTVKYFNPDSGLYAEPFILVPEHMEHAYQNCIKALSDHLIRIYSKSKFKLDINRINYGSVIPEKYRKNALIISLGETKAYHELSTLKPTSALEGKEEGFLIDYQVNDGVKYLFVHSKSTAGMFYGAQLAAQLFKGFTIAGARIISYPELDNRSVIIENSTLNSDIVYFMEKYGINALFKTGQPLQSEYIESHGIYYINDHGISQVIREREFMVIDKNKIPDLSNVIQIAEKHSATLKNLSQTSKKIYFLPSLNTAKKVWENQACGDVYFHQLKELENIQYLWFGVRDLSQFCDDVQLHYLEKKTGKKTVFVNNFQDAKTPSIKMSEYYKNYPEKIPMGSIFDPFDNVQLPVRNDAMMLKINKTDIFSVFRIATFAEYAWNNKAYDPELSLFKIIVNEFGERTARFLYIYNDAHCGLLTTINKVSTEGITNRTTRSAADEIASLNIAYDQIVKGIPDKSEFTDVLLISKKMLIEKYNAVYEKAVVNKKIQEDSLYSSIFTQQNENE